ncbi:unnamed protein product [Paramecium pentaurelia]|uniref:Uncharacterized protein n=1 Tax=Paramecium pentaurelia TaxID=43138 RepID=A0A8S1VJU4_9CILI|nr:unnamed protein product [Paramecium pentaurelia]
MLKTYMEKIGFKFQQEDLVDKTQFKNSLILLNDFNQLFYIKYMNKCYSQRIIITQEEYQRIQSQVNQSLQTNSKSRIKQKPQPEQYLFKPEINKQSINLQRSINDLYRWNQNKYQKINQIKEDEIRQIQNNANRLTHEIPSISVFERLYQLRKSSDTQIQQSKRSTYNNKPNYTQNMTNSMYQQYQRQCQFINTIQSKSKTQATENSQMQTPIQNNLDYELHESKNNIHQMYKSNLVYKRKRLKQWWKDQITGRLRKQRENNQLLKNIIMNKQLIVIICRLNKILIRKYFQIFEIVLIFITIIYMNNYDQLIQKLDQDPHLQILKQDYATIIDSMKDTDLSVRQMIAILWAAENDCLKFTSEIDKLNAMIQQLQQQLLQENVPQESILSAEDEHQEILYEIEQQLIFNVQKLSENQLINFTIQKYDKLDYQTAMDIITKFIESKCLNKEVEGILNQQLQDQMIKYQKKNYILQIENMKILSNTNSKDFYQKHKKLQSYNFDRIKLKFHTLIKEIKNIKKELLSIKEQYQMQIKLLFHQDNIIDKMLTSQQFNVIYNKILTQLNHQRKYFNISGQVQQSLLASQQIDNNDISIVFDKLQQKLINQIAKTACQVTANFEEIVTSRQINNNYLELILNSTKANFTKILKYNKMISSIQQEKETLQGQIRSSMECLIQKLNNENIKLKLIHLTNVLEKSFKKQSQSSLESLKSIQYH